MRNKKIWAFVLHYLFTFRFVCETVCFAKYETRFAWKMVYFAKYETRETNWIFSSKTKLVFHENLENYETKKFEWQPYVPTIKFETMTKNLVSQKCFFLLIKQVLPARNSFLEQNGPFREIRNSFRMWNGLFREIRNSFRMENGIFREIRNSRNKLDFFE